MKIIVYGKPACQYCEAAKRVLTEKKFDFAYQDITVPGFDVNYLQTIIAPGYKTVPIIVIEDQLIGGFEQLRKWIDAWQADVNLLRDVLEKGLTVSAIFTKQDGTERVIHCTQNSDFIPKDKIPASVSSRNKDPYLFTVFDVVKQEWRSFKAQSLKKIA